MDGNVHTAGEVPEKNKRRSVKGAAKRARRSRRKVISKTKACKILHEGRANDRPLTDPQRGYMAARCAGRPVRRRKAAGHG